MPALIELASGREVPQTRYSSGILAVLHSTQYLWITSYYQRREARGEGKTDWKFSRYLLTLVAGGIALFIPGPWIVSRVFHVDFAASFLLFTALVNIHHFLLDGALWKLRDSRIAAMLLDAQGKTGDADGAMGSKMLGATKWLAGPARLATTLRIALVLLLLGWGLLDQRHFYLASRTNDRTALERAASWIPDDSAVQVRLASAERSNGKTDAELEALSKAAATAPANFAVQEEYARGLIETKHYADASTLYQKILAENPKSARAWTNAGLLAARLGRGDEAVDDWQRAVDVDASQSNAQLYLAGALDQRGEIQAAARHYRAYLQIVAAHRDEHKAEGHQVIAALIKVADADTQQGTLAEALQGYKTAAAFGEKSGDKAMQSLALAHLAEAQDKSGDEKAAAASFQQALQLDAQLSDPQSRATDWFNYGEFLQRHQQEARLVYACYVQAENLLKNTPGEAQTAVSAERVQSETRIGRTAANEVRKRIEEELQQAISLSPSSFDRKH